MNPHLPCLAWLIAIALPPLAPAQEQANAPTTVSGSFVLPDPLPAGAQTKALDLARLEGSITLTALPGHDQKMDEIMGKPDNYDEMSKEEQREWFKTAAKNVDFTKHFGVLMKMRSEVEAIPPVPLSFDDDGSFKASGLRPGTWALEARIPHQTERQLSHAEGRHGFTVKADSTEITLGQLPLETHHVLIAGDPAPDFTAQTYDGKPLRLSDFRGKYVLIDFWATWCVPCVATIPDLVEVHEEFAGERFEIIGLSLDKTIGAAVKFHERKPSPYVHAYAGEKGQSEAAQKYGVRLIPSIWLIGPDGRILARDLRGNAIRRAVAKALKADGK